MTDRLDNVDIVVAVTQEVINQRLGRLFCAEQLLPDIGWQTIAPPSHTVELQGYPCLRSVDFATEGVRGEVSMTLRFAGDASRAGQFTYWSMQGGSQPVKQTDQFTELIYVFRAPLRSTLVVDPSTLATRAGVPGAARSRLCAIDPSQQSVYLLEVDPCATLDNYDSGMSAIVKVGATSGETLSADQLRLQTLQQLLKLYLQPLSGSSPFVLGYFVTTKNPPAGSWAPTSAGFSLFDAPAGVEGGSTLNFLMNAGRSVGPNDGALKQTLLPAPLPRGLQGRLAVSKRLFVDAYVQRILDEVRAALALPTTPGFVKSRTGLSWTASSTPAARVTKHYNLEVSQAESRTVTVTLDNAGSSVGGGSSVRLSGTGTLAQSCEVTEMPLNKKVGEVTSTLTFQFGVWLVAGPEGTIVGGWQGPGHPTPKQTRYEDPVYTAVDKVRTLLAQHTFSDFLAQVASSMNSLQTGTVARLNQDTVDLLNGLRESVTLPFGESLFFKNLTVDGDGNLLAEVRWKASTLRQRSQA